MRWRGSGDNHAVQSGPVQFGAFKDRGDIHGWHIEFSGKPFGMCRDQVGDTAKNPELCEIAGEIPAPHATSYESDACHRHLLSRNCLD